MAVYRPLVNAAGRLKELPTTDFLSSAVLPAALASIYALTPAADRLPYYDGTSSAALATFTAGGRALVNSAGTANTFPYFSASNTVTLGSITAAGRALLDDADAAAQRTTLELGTAATQNTGTSGATLPFLNGTNTWANAQTFSGGIVAGATGLSGNPLIVNAAAASAYMVMQSAGSNIIFIGRAASIITGGGASDLGLRSDGSLINFSISTASIGTWGTDNLIVANGVAAGTQAEILRLKVGGYGVASVKKGLTWHDGSSITGGIWTSYNGTYVSMSIGHLYNSGYQTTTLLEIAGQGWIKHAGQTAAQSYLQLNVTSSAYGYVGNANALVTSGSSSHMAVRGESAVVMSIGSTQVAQFTSTGLNACVLGATTAAAATVTTLSITEGPMVPSTYTPGAGSGAANLNIEAITYRALRYIRFGNTVFVDGYVTVDPDLGATTTRVSFTLPITSDLGAATDLSGIGICATATPATRIIVANTTDNKAEMTWTTGTTTSHDVYVSFSYRII